MLLGETKNAQDSDRSGFKSVTIKIVKMEGLLYGSNKRSPPPTKE
jgi:hypothetical protein